MNREKKTELSAELKEKFQKAKVAIFVNYKGLTATQADLLRKQVRGTEGEVKVIKNNVARMLIKQGAVGSDAAAVLEDTVGPTLIAFGYGDVAATAKVVHKFSKDIEAFQIKDCLLGDRRSDAASVEALASLPSREVLLAQLLGQMNAPIANFVGVLAAVPRSLVNVLSAVQRKKESAA